MFEVRCHGCQNTFEVDERRVPRNGMTMRCPSCQTTFLVRRPETMAFGVPAVSDAGGFKVAPPPGAAQPPPPPIAARVPPPPPPMSLHRSSALDDSLPVPADLAPGLPVARTAPSRQTTPGTQAIATPAIIAPAADPTEDPSAWSLDLPQEPDIPSAPSVSGHVRSPSSADARATLALGASREQPQSNVVARPSPRPVADNELGLPALRDASLPAVPTEGLPSPGVVGLPALAGVGLPVVAAAALPSLSGAALPAPSAGLPSLAAGLPMNPAGLPMNPAGLPMNPAGLPMNPAGLPMNPAGLPMNPAGLPMNSAELPRNPAELPRNPAELPRNPAELPRNPAELPRNPAELPSFEPEASTPGSATLGGMKLGRIGLERKAFTLSADSDLPIPVQAGVALPAPVNRERLGRRDDFEPETLGTARQRPTAEGFDPFGIPQASPEVDLAEFGVAPNTSAQSGSDFSPSAEGFVSNVAGAGQQFTVPGQTQQDPIHPSFEHGEFTGLPTAGAATVGGTFEKLRSRLTQFGRARPAAVTESARTEAKPKTKPKPQAQSGKREVPWRSVVLYGGLGLVAAVVVGGAALAGTEYGAFGKNYIDDQLHGPERHAAATRVIQYVDRRMEHDTYDYALGGLRRLEEALQRVPKENDLKAYIAYANSFVTLRFGADPTRTGRARALLTELREAPPSTHYLALARGADALARGNAREALRLARTQPAGRDLATLAAAELADTTQWLRFATTGRQRRPTARSRYLLAKAYFTTGDLAGARRMAEEVLRSEPRHPSARILLARILGQREADRGRALEILADLVGSGRSGQPSAASVRYASPAERADAFVVAGQVELSRDRVSVAQSRFQKALELEPRSSAALVGMGSILYRQGNFTDAQARFRNAFSADRHNTDAVIGMAQSALALDQAVEAKNALEPAVRENPNDGRLHYWLGRSLAATSDQRSLAQQEYREAIRLMPGDLEAYVALSELLTAMQRYDTADQVLVEARTRVPDNAAIHRALANSRLARGDVEGAQAELHIALEKDPDDLRAHFAMGDVFRRLGRLEDAARELDTVARIDPAYPGLSLARGQLAEARGELPQALATFREALAREPTNVDLINRVASTLVALGNYGDADQMLRSVVVDQPNNAESQYVMGRARLGAGNFADAVHYLNRAVELNPNQAEYKAYAAEAHRRTGDIVRAQQLAEQSIELDPSFPRGYWVRAEIRVHQGGAAEALADINRAVQLDRNFWEAYATWADIDDALGRHSEAVRLLQLATSHDARHGEWFYNLGRLLSDMGRNGEARAALLQVRSLGTGLTPTPTWFVQGTRRLADIERTTNPANARALYLEFLRMVPPNSPAYQDVQGALLDMNSGA